jgi:hypothetical protein
MRRTDRIARQARLLAANTQRLTATGAIVNERAKNQVMHRME